MRILLVGFGRYTVDTSKKIRGAAGGVWAFAPIMSGRPRIPSKGQRARDRCAFFAAAPKAKPVQYSTT